MKVTSLNDGESSCEAKGDPFLEAPKQDPLVLPEEQNLLESCQDVCSETITLSIDEAIEMIGTGKFQMLVLIASGLCFAADAMQVTLLSFLVFVLKDEWNLTREEAEFITSCFFAGSLFGTLVLGPLADVKGRRPIFLFSAFTISAFGIGTAAATNYWVLLASIFAVGFGVGGLTVPFDILAEFLPAASRGHNLLMIEYFWTLGVLYVGAAAYGAIHPDHVHWRLLTALSALPCTLAFLMAYLFVPESARWLVDKGRHEEAMEILRRASTVNGHDCDELFPDNMKLSHQDKEKNGTILDLVGEKWIFISVRLWGAWAAFAFGYYGTLLASTKVFSYESDRATSPGTVSFDFVAIFISSCAEFVGTTIVIVAIDTVGRIPAQALSYGLGGLSVCLLCSFAEMKIPRVYLVAVGFCARVFEMAGTCATWVSTAEILTTEVRSTGHSTANAMARVGAFFSPYLVQGNTPFVRVGIIMLAVHAFTVLCVVRLPETKGRKLGGPSNNEEVEDVEHSLLIADGNTIE